MKRKSDPVRICVGCQDAKPKKELLRVVLAPDETISIDKTGKKPGRGAYLCAKETCFEQAFKAKRLERSLKHSVTAEVYEALRKELNDE